MKDFNIILNNSKGLTLTALVKYSSNHFIVKIHDLKLTVKVLRNKNGKLECVEYEELHSNLVNDICDQIKAQLSKIDE